MILDFFYFSSSPQALRVSIAQQIPVMAYALLSSKSRMLPIYSSLFDLALERVGT